MGKKKVLDLVKASNEEATKTVLEDIVPEIVKQYGSTFLPEAVAVVVGDILGAILPRCYNIVLGYKQKRLEKNVLSAIKIISERCELLEQRIDALSDKEKIQGYTEMLLDNITDEIQESKVYYSVNGYVNLLCSDNVNEDMALMFFRTLAQLSDLDIRVLGLFDLRNRTETVHDIMRECNIDSNQYRFVCEKLERFGLLQSNNDEIDENNLDAIINYIKEVDKNNKKKNPGTVKMPNLKKKFHIDTFRITSLGIQYLKLIEYDEKDNNSWNL